MGAALCGAATGAFSTILSTGIFSDNPVGILEIIINSAWRIFIFTIFSVIGLLVTEINMPEPSEFGSRNFEAGSGNFEVGSGNAEVGKKE